MKICLNPYVEGSGIGTYTLELARYLAKHTDHEIIAIGDKKLTYPRLKIIESPKKRNFLLQIPPISWINDPLQDYNISKIVNEIKPDIFHTSNHIVFNRMNSPTIQVGWDYPKGIVGCIKLALKYEIWWMIPYRIIREMEMSIKDYFALKTAKKNLGVTNDITHKLLKKGYNAEFIPPCISIKPNYEKKFPKFTITFIGRNHIWIKRKGLELLLDALMHLELNLKNSIKEPLDYNLIVIGNVPKGFDNVLNRYKAIKEHIIVKGLLSREETLNIMKKSHLIAAPSLYDEFCFAALESMSYGIPVIASKHNIAFNEIIGDSGVLVDIYNKNEFAKELFKLIYDKNRIIKLGKNAISRVEKHYSWTAIGPKILKTYESLIQNKV